MMKTDNHAETIERALASIASHEDEKAVATARQLLLGELKRVEASQADFHGLVAQSTCTVKITFGCIFTTQRMAGEPEEAPHGPHAVNPAARMATAQRTPIGWGGGRCWYGRNCWICIEYECRA